MSEHEVTVVHTPGAGGCLYGAVCTCGAISETLFVHHKPEDPDACGAARRSLYVWEREHAGEGAG